MRLVNISDTLALSVETRGFTLGGSLYSIYKKEYPALSDVLFILGIVAGAVLVVFRRYFMKSLILQKCIIKIVIGLILSFLWAQYLRVSTAMTMAEFPMIFLGAFYLMLAWFNYLKLD